MRNISGKYDPIWLNKYMVDDNLNIKSLWGDLPRVQKFEFVRNLTSFINDDNKTLTYWQCVAKYADD